MLEYCNIRIKNMSYKLPNDIQSIKEQTRKFVEKELKPLSQQIEQTGVIPEECLSRIREMGYFGILIPEEYGGAGLNTLASVVIQEELGRAHGCFNMLLSGNNGIGAMGVLYDGTEEQKQKYLKPLAQGKMISAFALSEPGAGSDIESITTKASNDGSHYILNGLKHYISRFDIADIFTVMAVTNPSKRAQGGITAFLVERGTPGLSIGRVEPTMGSNVIKIGEVILEDCRIPMENVIGDVGYGIKTAKKVLEVGRISLAARSLGMAQELLEMSVKYAKNRVQFGKPIGEYQLIQAMLADMFIEITATRSLLYELAWKRDQSTNIETETAVVKLFASEMLDRVADKALQIHGAMGYMKECPVELMYREARVMRLLQGTSEIMRLSIARDLLRD